MPFGGTHPVKYKLLGNSGLRISELALGAMTFGTADWGVEKDESRVAFGRAAQGLVAIGRLRETPAILGEGCAGELADHRVVIDDQDEGQLVGRFAVHEKAIPDTRA